MEPRLERVLRAFGAARRCQKFWLSRDSQRHRRMSLAAFETARERFSSATMVALTWACRTSFSPTHDGGGQVRCSRQTCFSGRRRFRFLCAARSADFSGGFEGRISLDPASPLLEGRVGLMASATSPQCSSRADWFNTGAADKSVKVEPRE